MRLPSEDCQEGGYLDPDEARDALCGVFKTTRAVVFITAE